MELHSHLTKRNEKGNNKRKDSGKSNSMGMMNFIKVERLKLILSIFHMIKGKKKASLIPLPHVILSPL